MRWIWGQNLLWVSATGSARNQTHPVSRWFKASKSLQRSDGAGERRWRQKRPDGVRISFHLKFKFLLISWEAESIYARKSVSNILRGIGPTRNGPWLRFRCTAHSASLETNWENGWFGWARRGPDRSQQIVVFQHAASSFVFSSTVW